MKKANEPKYVVLIEWNPLTLVNQKKPKPVESFRFIRTEAAAKKILGKRSTENIMSAMWYNGKRTPIDLLKRAVENEPDNSKLQ